MFIDLDVAKREHRFQFFTSTKDILTGEIIYNEPSGDAYVTLRAMQPFFEERYSKRKMRIDYPVNKKTNAIQRIPYIPELTPEERQAEKEETWDYVIVDFEGFKNKETGEIIPCNKANKNALMQVPMFDRFISRCLTIIDETGIEEKEELEKN